MIKKLLTLLLFYLCTLVLPVEAAITRGVGPVSGDNVNTPTATATLNGTTIGRMIVLVIGYNGSTISSVTISGEADPTIISAFNMSANGDSFAIYYLANNIAGGNKTITVNFVGAAYSSMIAIEYAGADTTTQPDATTTSTTGGSFGVDPSISITTLTAGALIVSVCSSNGGKPTVPSGYTSLSLNNPGYYAAAADEVDSGIAGGKTLTWTGVTSSTWGVSAVAFKAAAVGSTTPARHSVIQ